MHGLADLPFYSLVVEIFSEKWLLGLLNILAWVGMGEMGEMGTFCAHFEGSKLFWREHGSMKPI